MSSPTGELIPDAIDALLAIAAELQTGGDLAGTALVRAPEVLDGTEPADVTGNFLVIGIDGEDDIAGTTTSGQAGLAAPRRRDLATVTCIAYASGGNSDMSVYRAAAFAWYRALRGAVETDPRLGGAVTFAEVVSAIYRPRRSGAGAGAAVEFRVQVTSL